MIYGKKRKLEAELHRLQRVMGLQLWDLQVEYDDLEGLHANVQPGRYTAEANMLFDNGLLDEPWRTQQRVLLHELLHLAHQDVMDHVEVMYDLIESDETREALRAGFLPHEERFIDHLSRVLLPLI